MKKYAIIKDEALLYIMDSLPTRQEYYTEKEMEKIMEKEPQFFTPEEAETYIAPTNIKTPGIDYDEVIEFDFEGNPIYTGGKIIEDPTYRQRKIQDIINEIGESNSLIATLKLIGDDTKDLEARVEELKKQYKALV